MGALYGSDAVQQTVQPKTNLVCIVPDGLCPFGEEAVALGLLIAGWPDQLACYIFSLCGRSVMAAAMLTWSIMYSGRFPFVG